LRLRAYDKLDLMRHKSRARTLERAAFSSLVSNLCAPHGITPVGFEGAAVVTGAQSGRTDFELLSQLTLTRGFYFHLEGDRLVGFRLRAGEPRAKKRWGDFWMCRFERSQRRASGRVRVTGSTLAESGVFSAEAEADGSIVADGMENHRLGAALHSDAEAAALAEGLAERTGAGARVFHGTLIPGDISLRPGVTLEVSNVPAQSAQSFVLTHVVHGYDAEKGGFFTELSSAPPENAMSKGLEQVGVQLGEVRELDDRGRVRVHFPTHDALSDWLRVVVPGAGPARGFACLPDVGDQVVVLTPDADPLHGVVLGGVWDGGPDDAGVASGRRRRVQWRLDRAHIDIDADEDRLELTNAARARLKIEKKRITADARGGVLELSDGQGSRFELSGRESKWSSAAPLVIEAPGKTLTIRAARINFEEG
jgi:phage baseplate assembly protein gpV